MKYTPTNAVLDHSLGGQDNACFTVDNRTNPSDNWWYEWYPTQGSKLIVFFDYEVVLGDKDTSYYQFKYMDSSRVWHTVNLTGKGHFSIELDERDVFHFAVNCSLSSLDLASGTYMLIDSIGFGECEA